MMNLKEIGESGLIELIRKKVNKEVRLLPLRSAQGRNDIIAGIGDDAAVIRSGGKNLTLLTTDMLIENVHFSIGKMSFPQIGHKALAVNLSDIAAMGGLPRFCLVSLGLPPSLRGEDIDEIYDGILSLAEQYGVKVLGGDTNLSPSGLIIDVCLIGEVEPEFLCLRSSAKAGDSIFVTGSLGGAASRLAKGEYLPPTPRIKEARAILETGGVNAMIDLSDGLKDLHAIAVSSNVGAIVYAENIPVSPGAQMKLALSGGEDFELLLTVPEAEVRKLPETIPAGMGTALTRIGKIVERNRGVSIRGTDGEISSLPAEGYDHFRRPFSKSISKHMD